MKQGQVLEISWLLLVLLIAFEPWLTRKNVIFGVVFSQNEFWTAGYLKKLRWLYFGLICLVGIMINFSVQSFGSAINLIIIGLPLILLLGIIAFGVFHRLVWRWQEQQPTNHLQTKKRVTVDLKELVTNQLSPWWLGFLLVMPLLAGYLAVTNYQVLPASLPIHYSLNGPDSWLTKQRACWLILANQVLLAVTFIVTGYLTRQAAASVHGSPQATPGYYHFRRSIYFFMIFAGLVSQIILLTPLLKVNHLTTWLNFLGLFSLPLLIGLPLLFFWLFIRRKKPHGPIIDDNSNWIWGMIYYNRNDPAIFVQKRSGLGFTFNMAHQLSWVYLIAFLGLITILGVLAN